MKLRMHIDGGSRGNPGPAACSVVLQQTETGAVLFEGGYFLGRMTNNAAEYNGLLHGLAVAQRFGATELEILSDSQLMVCQVRGEYRVKSADLLPLYERAKTLLSAFPKWRMTHVYREKNARADALANQAMDLSRDVVMVDTQNHHAAPPPAITPPALKVSFPQHPGGKCIAPPALGAAFLFTQGRTPAALCMHAAAAVLQTVLPTCKKNLLHATCAHCGTVIEIRTQEA